MHEKCIEFNYRILCPLQLCSSSLCTVIKTIYFCFVAEIFFVSGSFFWCGKILCLPKNLAHSERYQNMCEKCSKFYPSNVLSITAVFIQFIYSSKTILVCFVAETLAGSNLL